MESALRKSLGTRTCFLLIMRPLVEFLRRSPY